MIMKIPFLIPYTVQRRENGGEKLDSGSVLPIKKFYKVLKKKIESKGFEIRVRGQTWEL